MKTFNYFLISLALFASACSSTNKSAKNNTDDVYYSSKDAQKEIDAKKDAQLAAAEANKNKKTEADNYSSNNSATDNSNVQAKDDYYDPNAQTQTTSTTTTEGGNTYITNNYNDNSF